MKESFSTCCLSQDFDFPAECHIISREIATLSALSSLVSKIYFPELVPEAEAECHSPEVSGT